ncbi:MAG: endonuclease domain-containing protein [Chloroflexi bacterium]|nr:endonuclease domain-containing protein [Chloroflexota bacterium]
MTDAEALLWQALRRNQLEGLHFRRQQIIDGFIVDFYCHTMGLVVEVDGEVHDRQKEYDAQRDYALKARGLKVLHVQNEAVENGLPGVLERILQMARRPT